MKPGAVRETLGELEDRTPSRSPGGPRLPVDELGLERREPALGDGIIPALAPPGEALGDAVLIKEPAVVGGGVLAATVRVEDETRLGWRAPLAISRASQTSSARMWSAIAQPTTLREARSRTLAR